MENIKFSTSHLQINHSNRSSRSNECFAIGFEPDEKNLSTTGNLYLLYENPNSNKKINFEKIIESCGEAFYEKSDNFSFEERFKEVLKTINSFLKNQDPTNIVIVATSLDKMLFSDIGTATFMHIRGNSSTNLSSKTSSSTFKEIGQGKLHKKDKIIIASSEVINKINKKDLSVMVAKQPLDEFEKQLSDAMQSGEAALSYSTLLISADEQVKDIEPSVNTQDNSKPISDAKFKSLMLEIKRSIRDGGSKVQQKAKGLRKNNTKITSEIASKTKSGWTAVWSKYINPNPKQAIIVVLITILIIGLIIFLSSSANSKPKSINQLENAQALISSAKESLSKNNQASAQESIDKAEQILSKISPSESKKLDQLEKDKKISSGYTSTSASLQSVEDKLNLTIRIPSDKSFNIPQNSLKSLVWLNNSLFGLDSDAGNIIEINPLLGSPIVRASSTELKGAIAMDSVADSGLIILSGSGLYQYTADKGLQKLTASSLPKSNDISTYLGNVYLLSPQEGQVVRYTKNGLSLGAKTNLLKNVTNGELSKASSLAVNANIFISSGNNILLFEQGSERAYQLEGLPKSFGDIKDIFYSKDAGYFILLNQSSNRLAMLKTDSSSATYVRQYALDNDSKINSFTIEPKNSQILINSDSKIYSNKIEK